MFLCQYSIIHLILVTLDTIVSGAYDLGLVWGLKDTILFFSCLLVSVQKHPQHLSIEMVLGKCNHSQIQTQVHVTVSPTPYALHK